MTTGDVLRRHAGLDIEKTLIDTSSNNRALANCNQRKIDRCSNGVLWAVFWNGSNSVGNAFEFWFSEDDGESWSQNVGGSIGFGGTRQRFDPSISFFIDKDDYAHVAYVNRDTGAILYARGVPNEDCTAWTWQDPVDIIWGLNPGGEIVNDHILKLHPDLVAHRHGDGWMVHIVYSDWSPGFSFDPENELTIYYNRIRVQEDGSYEPEDENKQYLMLREPTNEYGYPSIDFHHTGDCKTVDGTPDLYVAWSSGATGPGRGIRFRKARYVGGTWVWNDTRTIDNTVYVSSESRWLNCIYDGYRVVIAGRFALSNGTVKCNMWDRNEADTNTSWKTSDPDALGSGGSLTFDESDTRNVYILSQVDDFWRLARYDRSTGLLTYWNITSSGADNTSFGSLKRGYSEGRIEFVFSDRLSAPYNVKFGGKRT